MYRNLACLLLTFGTVTPLSQLGTQKIKPNYAISNKATCYDKNNTVLACPAKCFCDPTYSEDEVLDTDKIEYSDKYNLLLHLFEPPNSDKRLKRPAMVMIHGGGFKSGNRNDKKGIIDWCHQLAMRGYVTVSIDYRLDHPSAGPESQLDEHTPLPPDYERANMDAMYDARAAVRWLRKNAEKYRIDQDRIGAFGSSAGAMTVAFMTTVAGEGDSGNTGYSSSISVGVSLSGALLPDPGLVNVTAHQPPFLDFHGCADCTVPYSSEACSKDVVGFDAVNTIATMQKAGRVASLYSFAGKGHVPWNDLRSPAAANTMISFLAEHLDLDHAECPTKPQS